MKHADLHRLYPKILGYAAVSVLVTGLIVSPWGNTARATDDENSVNLYSYRQAFLIDPLLDAFTEQTGIKVNTVFVKKGMLERLKAEGRNSDADMVLSADIGRLHDMVTAGVLQGVSSDKLNKNIPSQFRHPEGLWYGLTLRARIIFASKDRTQPGEVLSLADLAKPALQGRVCTRSGKHVYNVSLIASVIANEGIDQTRQWLTGLRDNLARKPQGNDRAQAKAISEGVCDYAIANTYYMGKMVTNTLKPEQQQWAAGIRIIFPDQDGHGTHVNISGAAITKSAKHRDNAIALLEFLSDTHAQEIYAEQNFEYPVKPDVTLHPLVSSWGKFKADTINLDKVAQHRITASKLVDETAFDLGPQND